MDRCPHILGAELPSGFSGNLVDELRAKDVYISQRGNSLRFAPHLFVTEDDRAKLLRALESVLTVG